MSASDYGVPQPPKIKKEWRFTKAQKLGMPFLFLIPLLALLGVLGPSAETVTESGEALSLEITYPTRFRYKTIAPMRIEVTNISSQSVPTVTVSVDREYLRAFSNVAFQPAVEQISDDAYYVQLSDLRAGETRSVALEMQAESYWEQQGAVAAAAGGIDAGADASVTVETFVFP